MKGNEERYVTIGMDALGDAGAANGRASYLLVKQDRKSASSTE